MNRQVVVSCDAVSGDYSTASYRAWEDRTERLRAYAELLGFQVYSESSNDTDDPITPVGRKRPVPDVPDDPALLELLQLAFEHVPDDCPHYDQIQAALDGARTAA